MTVVYGCPCCVGRVEPDGDLLVCRDCEWSNNEDECPACHGAGEILHPLWGTRSCPEPSIECPACHGAR